MTTLTAEAARVKGSSEKRGGIGGRQDTSVVIHGRRMVLVLAGHKPMHRGHDANGI